MLDIYTILGFISGGGITALITTFISFKYAKRTPKIDYTDRLSQFWESQNEKLLKRFEELETRVEGLENLSCERAECPNRVKSVA